MTGIPLHPLRLKALSKGRLSVLRVPFKVQPPDDSWFVGIGRSRGNPVAIFQAGATQYPVRLPYAPGEYFVREVTWEPTSIIIADVYYDAKMTDEKRKSVKALLYKRISTGRMNRDFARYIVTLGPPVPSRLGEVTEFFDEGVERSKRPPINQWDAIYPRHPYSPELWTWGYPMTWRRKS